jgi:predicted phosphodiesterase
MRCAILADIHANLAALTAVLEDIKKKGGVDEVWCLGDIVGYGPQPTECIRLLKQYHPVCVAGNHDMAAAGKLDLSYFNADAAYVCQWTYEKLNPVDIRYLEDLPLTVRRGEFLLAHGSPMEPLMEYLTAVTGAQKNFDFFDAPYCLVGHTHVPLAFRQENSVCATIPLVPGIGLVMAGHRLIVNPGAVGQPRDKDPRASYAIYDSEGHMLRLYRVDYDIRATQDKMMEERLPITLLTRLEQGK